MTLFFPYMTHYTHFFMNFSEINAFFAYIFTDLVVYIFHVMWDLVYTKWWNVLFFAMFLSKIQLVGWVLYLRWEVNLDLDFYYLFFTYQFANMGDFKCTHITKIIWQFKISTLDNVFKYTLFLEVSPNRPGSDLVKFNFRVSHLWWLSVCHFLYFYQRRLFTILLFNQLKKRLFVPVLESFI